LKNPDVAIVGGGIAGGAMAVVLARAGLNVLQLEKTLVHEDVVRGEWLAPWGVVEANALGLTDLYMSHGAHRINRHISYDELMSREEAEARVLNLAEMAPERPLCLGHPKTCDLLNEEAVRLGVTYKRGVTKIEATPGAPPALRYQHDGQAHEVQPRLIIGADGRNGLVAKQIGCEAGGDPEHHLFSGMLVEGAHDWPEDLQVIATEGDANILAFPQGGGKVRIYLGWPSEDRTRLLGPDGPKHFLESWRLDCVPNADVIANATPISRCLAYPNADGWVDSPIREGVVLIGDAAGRNDPITGQGLSITHRDVRMVSDALLAGKDWAPEIFDAYVVERKERMSRLRIAARLTSLRDSAFGLDGRKLREQIHERLEATPELAAPFAAPFLGPDALPAEVFAPEFTQAIVGRPLWEDGL
jgi:2-polyprenyl-6-methoxyphenol hydroxylase-like FAD-dependent oxidoreductase